MGSANSAVKRASNKIIWFLVGNPEQVASSRIQGLRLHNKLRELGYNSILAYTPLHIEEELPFDRKAASRMATLFSEGDMVILQKIKNEVNLPFLHFLKSKKVRLTLVDCDLPVEPSVASLCDKVICTSVALRNLYHEKGIVAEYIEDSPEEYQSAIQANGSTLTCYWFGDGSKEKWNDVVALKELIAKDPSLKEWKLVTISNHPDADLKWNKNSLKQLVKADAVAIPLFQANASSKVKSANRLLQSMALSKAVICSPLPSYMQVASSGYDALICANMNEWRQALVEMKDENKRNAIARNAFLTAKKYHLDSNIHNWIQSLQLGDQFKEAFAGQQKETELKVQQFFFAALLKRNIHYWKKEGFTLLRGWQFLQVKFLNARKKFSSGHLSFWG